MQYNPTTVPVRNVQFSFIHIGIRDYAGNVAGYPNQIPPTVDDFAALVGSEYAQWRRNMLLHIEPVAGGECRHPLLQEVHDLLRNP